MPATQVSWTQAKEFCAKMQSNLFSASQVGAEGLMAELKEMSARLPTEAEWEYACRAGTHTPFCFGDCLSSDLANFNGVPLKGCPKSQNRQSPCVVGLFPANAWGLHDLHGNVCEWCEDGYQDSYFGAPRDARPRLVPAGARRIIRGGSWATDARRCRSASRYGLKPETQFEDVGFRVVVGPKYDASAGIVTPGAADTP